MWQAGDDPATAATLKQLHDRGRATQGTGTAAQIPGIQVAGKTGTAETGTNEPPHAWFIAFAPADNPQYAVAVLVEHGGVSGRRRSDRWPGRGAHRRAGSRGRCWGRNRMRPCTRVGVDSPRQHSSEWQIGFRHDVAGRPGLFEPLRIEREIAQGGMAEVYLARDQSLDRPVALEGALPRVRARAVVRRAVPARGAGRRQPQPPEHRRDLRLGPGGGHVLHRDGVRRRPLAARPDPQRRRRSTRARPPTSPPRSRRRSRSRIAAVSCTAT